MLVRRSETLLARLYPLNLLFVSEFPTCLASALPHLETGSNDGRRQPRRGEDFDGFVGDTPPALMTVIICDVPIRRRSVGHPKLSDTYCKTSIGTVMQED